MSILSDLAKLHHVDISEYLNASEVRALEGALSNPAKFPAAKVLLNNLQKKMKADQAGKMKKGLNSMFPGLDY